jgi:hypothetical protein
MRRIGDAAGAPAPCMDTGTHSTRRHRLTSSAQLVSRVAISPTVSFFSLCFRSFPLAPGPFDSPVPKPLLPASAPCPMHNSPGVAPVCGRAWRRTDTPFVCCLTVAPRWRTGRNGLAQPQPKSPKPMARAGIPQRPASKAAKPAKSSV